MANVAFGHLFAYSGIANSTYYAGIDLGMSLGADCWRTAVRQCADPMVLSVVHADHASRMAAVCGYGELRSWADSVIGRKARKPAGHAGQVHFSNGARIFNICCL